MSAVTAHSQVRLARLLDEDDLITQKQESLVRAIEERPDKTMTEVESEHLTMYREKKVELAAEIDQLSSDVEAAKNAIEKGKAIRRALAGAEDGVQIDEDGIVYRDFYTYARDVVLSRDLTASAKLARQWTGGEGEVIAMRERLSLLKRTPANTLSSNVGGLQPPQYIDQIFQVINKSRPLVDAAKRTPLERGQLTYPKVSQRPVVGVQATEKSEAGNQGMLVEMATVNAKTYLGGGDLSWQAINWSTPDALQLWFDLAAADYALQTEEAAAKAVLDDAFTNGLDSGTLSSTPDFATLMTAVGAGYAEVFENSGRIADTIILSPDRFGYILGLTSTPQAIFVSVNGQTIGPLNILTSRGLDAPAIIVGDMKGLLVAETAGAPVELRTVEPAIGGIEVGIIGAFAGVVVDPGAFCLLTTAS